MKSMICELFPQDYIDKFKATDVDNRPEDLQFSADFGPDNNLFEVRPDGSLYVKSSLAGLYKTVNFTVTVKNIWESLTKQH